MGSREKAMQCSTTILHALPKLWENSSKRRTFKLLPISAELSIMSETKETAQQPDINYASRLSVEGVKGADKSLGKRGKKHVS